MGEGREIVGRQGGLAGLPLKSLHVLITIERRIASGAVGDTDVYGAQQHAPLLDVEIPI